jgi:hypothetical protein
MLNDTGIPGSGRFVLPLLLANSSSERNFSRLIDLWILSKAETGDDNVTDRVTGEPTPSELEDPGSMVAITIGAAHTTET